MPPRKSDGAKSAVGEEAPSASTPAKADKDGVNIEDLNLPKSIVTRLAKGVLPPNTQIQGNAMLAMTKSATVFVSFLATHANEYAQSANRKTVAPADVLKALSDIEFPDFRERVEEELEKFNEILAEKRKAGKKKAVEKVKGGEGEANEGEGEGEHRKKKARLEEGVEVRDGETHEENEDEAQDEHDDDRHDEHDDAEEHDEDEDEEDEEDEEEDEGHEEHEEHEDEDVGHGHDHEAVDEDEALDNGEDSD